MIGQKVKTFIFKHSMAERTNFPSVYLNLQGKTISPLICMVSFPMSLNFLICTQTMPTILNQEWKNYNDRVSKTKDYFQSTNHSGITTLKQQFLKK